MKHKESSLNHQHLNTRLLRFLQFVKRFPVSQPPSLHHNLYLNKNKHEQLWTNWSHWIYSNGTLLPLNLQTAKFLAQEQTTTWIAMFTPILSLESYTNIHTLAHGRKLDKSSSSPSLSNTTKRLFFFFHIKHKVFQSMCIDISIIL